MSRLDGVLPSRGHLPDGFSDDGDSAAAVRWVTAPNGTGMWLVSDYTLARDALTDPRLSRAAAVAPGAPKMSDVEPAPNAIMSLDGPEHTRLRRIVAGAFTARRVADFAPRVEEIVDGLLDGLERAGPGADLVPALAEPLPIAVLCRLLGIPDSDQARFRSWLAVLFDITTGATREKAQQRLALVRYMAGLVGRKRREPGDDLMTLLVEATDERGALTEGELVNLGLALLMAGYETTVGQLGLCMLAVLHDEDARVAVRDRTGAMPAVVEELLRVVPSGPIAFPRVAVAPAEIGGVTVRPGEAVVISLIAANHDPRAFTDPERVSPERPAAPHLTFGHGIHRCVGAHLARQQVSVALGRLFARFPGLRVADGPEPVRWQPGLATWGLARLTVQW